MEFNATPTGAKMIHASKIGPFNFDQVKQTITLDPGTYILNKPITFGITEETKISELCHHPPTDDIPDQAMGNVFINCKSNFVRE